MKSAENTYRESAYRIMISGGGTGGHIYPAVSIAQSLQEILSEVEILFVGAEGRMEMKKVPEAGFQIVGLWISGLQRKLSFQNLLFPVKLFWSIMKSFQLLSSFKPDAVIGVGGYASGPLLYAATFKGIPTLIQEQNSYAGLTNKWLAKRVDRICVAHEGMEKYFPKEKLVVTGNPVRKSILLKDEQVSTAYKFFGFKAEYKTLLIVGGSLGARSVNEFILAGYDRLRKSNYQVIWQTGGYYYEEIMQRIPGSSDRIVVRDFIREMDYAYAIADVVVSRAGALSIAELMLTGKASILVPSPNVAEDHQTINARALEARNAAILVPDNEAATQLLDLTFELLEDEKRREKLSANISAMSRPNAARDISNEILKMIA